MTITRFLSFIWPDLSDGSAYPSIVTFGQTMGQPYHHHVTSASSAEHYANTKLSYNIYFTPFSHTKARRNASTAHLCRCFFVDLDCGPGKPYANQAEALNALMTVCKDTGFPPPNAIVNSGNGVHGYWVINVDLPRDDWLTIAGKLKKFLLGNGLHIDKAVTADPARIMRLPETFNFKDGKKTSTSARIIGKPIVLAVLTNALNAIPKAPAQQLLPSSGSGAVDTGLGILIGNEPSLAERIVQSCPVMEHVRNSHGAHCNEPMWKATLQLLVCCTDGQDYAHPMSDGHSGYSEAQTNRKFHDRKLANAKGVGPPTCDAIASLHASWHAMCQTCEHHGQIRSPVILGREENNPLLSPPGGFFREGSGIYTMNAKDEPYVICYGLAGISLEEYSDPTRQDSFIIAQSAGGRTMPLPYKDITQIEQIRGVFGTEITLASKNRQVFDTMMTAWVNQLRTMNRGILQMPGKIGWNEDATAFVACDKLIEKTPVGVRDVPLYAARKIPAMQVMQKMDPRGNLVDWSDHVNMLLRSGAPEFNAIMAQAFAASLVTFWSDAPAISVLSSRQTGIGKSTILKAAASVWFQPKSLIDMHDTRNFINAMIMSSHDVPVIWDELQVFSRGSNDLNSNARDLIDIIFRATQGRDRGRMAADTSLRQTMTNIPMIIISSNMSVADKLAQFHNQAPTAVLARILQLEPKQMPKGQIMDDTLRFHHGVAGEAFIRFLLENYTRQDLVGEITKVVNKLRKIPALRASEARYWVANVATSIVAARLVNQSGLLTIDEGAVQVCLLKAAAKARTGSTETQRAANPHDAIKEFLDYAASVRRVAWTEQRPVRGRPPLNATPPKIDLAADVPRNELMAWMSSDGKWARVRATLLDRKLTDGGFDAPVTIAAMKRSGVVTESKRIAYDPVSKLTSRAYDIDVERLAQLMA